MATLEKSCNKLKSHFTSEIAINVSNSQRKTPLSVFKNIFKFIQAKNHLSTDDSILLMKNIKTT